MLIICKQYANKTFKENIIKINKYYIEQIMDRKK